MDFEKPREQSSESKQPIDKEIPFEERERRLEIQITEYVWKYLKMAIDLQSSDIANGRPILKVHEYLKTIWKGPQGKGTVSIPHSEFPDVKGSWRFNWQGDEEDYGTADTKPVDDQVDEFAVNIYMGIINDARGEVRQSRITEAEGLVRHEGLHIFHSGSNPESVVCTLESILQSRKDPKFCEEIESASRADDRFLEKASSVLYLSDPNEIVSFASQYATLFYREFPGETFSIEKMLTIKDKYPRCANGIENYLVKFNEPETQNKYDFVQEHFGVANLSSVHRKFVMQMIRFVEYMNNRERQK